MEHATQQMNQSLLHLQHDPNQFDEHGRQLYMASRLLFEENVEAIFLLRSNNTSDFTLLFHHSKASGCNFSTETTDANMHTPSTSHVNRN